MVLWVVLSVLGVMVVVVVAVQDARVRRRRSRCRRGRLRERQRHVLRPSGPRGTRAAVLQHARVMSAGSRRSRHETVDGRRLRTRLDVLLLGEAMVGAGPRGRSCSHHVSVVERRVGRQSAQPLVVHVVTERQTVGRLSHYTRRVRVSGARFHRRLLMLMLLLMRLLLLDCLVLTQHLISAEHNRTSAGARRRRRRKSVDVERVGGGGRHLSTSGTVRRETTARGRRDVTS